MPIYEYVCSDCDARFEKYLRAWNEAVACPTCAGEQVEKQLSAFAFASGSGSSASAPPVASGGGSCCGRGGCGCH
jgi:putative FmdB family regulatory protein